MLYLIWNGLCFVRFFFHLYPNLIRDRFFFFCLFLLLFLFLFLFYLFSFVNFIFSFLGRSNTFGLRLSRNRLFDRSRRRNRDFLIDYLFGRSWAFHSLAWSRFRVFLLTFAVLFFFFHFFTALFFLLVLYLCLLLVVKSTSSGWNSSADSRSSPC